jgi:VCBS repeat-containing protein
MKKQQIILILLLALAGGINLAVAQGTAFTYQGFLTDSSGPLNGTFSLTFKLYDAPTLGNQLPMGSPITIIDTVAISGGLFTTNLDFQTAFNGGGARWLEINVGANPPLSPRQPVTPAPYAIYAENAGGVSGGNYIWSAINGGGIFYNGGNVGIGTPSPAFQLDVYSAGAASARLYSVNNLNGAVLELRQDAANPNYTGAINFNDAGNYGGQLGYNPNNGMTFRSGGFERARILPSGKVGIGTSSPNALLDVAGNYSTSDMRVSRAGNPSAALVVEAPGGSFISSVFGVISGSFTPAMALEGNGGVALGSYSDGGTQAPAHGLVVGGNVGVGTPAPDTALHVINPRYVGQSVSAGLHIEQPISGDFAHIQLNVTGSPFWDIAASSGSTPTLKFGSSLRDNVLVLGTDGTVQVPVLQINGADVAEPFDVSTKDIRKGSVVVIDEEHAGQLKLSDHAYDAHVAGILSGANGVHPGIRLKQEGFNDRGEEVALSGRVYALADASTGAICPGDLLTTSDTPGHCMKATDHVRAQGAIIGKAMSALLDGRGMVLVLVSLQ